MKTFKVLMKSTTPFKTLKCYERCDGFIWTTLLSSPRRQSPPGTMRLPFLPLLLLLLLPLSQARVDPRCEIPNADKIDCAPFEADCNAAVIRRRNWKLVHNQCACLIYTYTLVIMKHNLRFHKIFLDLTISNNPHEPPRAAVGCPLKRTKTWPKEHHGAFMEPTRSEYTRGWTALQI